MVFFIYYSKRFFLNLKGSFDGKVVSLTKREYGSAVYFLKVFIKSLMIDVKQFAELLFY